MRIGLLSDTHIPEVQRALPPELKEAFKGVDLILHGGDIYSLNVLDDLENIAPVLAALGDDDYPGPDNRIKEKHILEVEGLTLWLLHMRHMLAFPSKSYLTGGPAQVGDNHKPDIIVFGHEHRTVVESQDGILYICSGSPTMLHYHRGLGTVGILEVNEGKANISLVHL
ncbi:MAG: metallophosphoesterase family protein [Chloroflexi bacterium]|nr:metallophosphoesterase family protein [Chloroflexota bacterium]